MRNKVAIASYTVIVSLLCFCSLSFALIGDINGDNIIDFNDLEILSDQWLNDDCNVSPLPVEPNPAWCYGADIDCSHNVDFVDYALLAENCSESEPVVPPIAQWYQGDIHYHTTNSDGSQTLATMVAVNRDSGGHDFTCVADHDYISDANQYTTGSFLGINGVEASGGPHVIGLGMSSLGSFSGGSTLQSAINAINADGGLPMVAHVYWSEDYQGYDMSTLLSGMTDCNHISVYNHYCEGVWGNGNSEAYWDELLTAGKVIYGHAESDTHGTGRAGYSYNMIGASELSLEAVKTAIKNGDYYFCHSTVKWAKGITITAYTISGTGAGDTISITTDAGQTIQFIGNNGSVLQTTNSNEGSYTITGTENYVRIKITNSDGDTTWTQPVFITGS